MCLFVKVPGFWGLTIAAKWLFLFYYKFVLHQRSRRTAFVAEWFHWNTQRCNQCCPIFRRFNTKNLLYCIEGSKWSSYRSEGVFVRMLTCTEFDFYEDQLLCSRAWCTCTMACLQLIQLPNILHMRWSTVDPQSNRLTRINPQVLGILAFGLWQSANSWCGFELRSSTSSSGVVTMMDEVFLRVFSFSLHRRFARGLSWNKWNKMKATALILRTQKRITAIGTTTCEEVPSLVCVSLIISIHFVSSLRCHDHFSVCYLYHKRLLSLS